jgi:hypothetical protein
LDGRELHWPYKTVPSVEGERECKMYFEKKSQMIQSDLSLLGDFESSILGIDGYKEAVLPEYLAEEKLEEAQRAYQAILEDEPTDPRDWYLWIKKAVVRGVTAQLTEGSGKQNSAAIEAEEECSRYYEARRAEREFQYRKAWLEKQAYLAHEHLEETRLELDLSLAAQAAQHEEIVELPTKEQAEREQGLAVIPFLSDGTLMVALDDPDPQIRAKAEQEHLDRQVAQHRLLSRKVKKYQGWATRHFSKEEYAGQESSYKISQSRSLAEASRAEEYFSVCQGLRTLFGATRSLEALRADLRAAAEAMKARRQANKKKAEKAFWARQTQWEVPVVEIQQGQKFWFKDPRTGEFLDGACTEVKYLSGWGEAFTPPAEAFKLPAYWHYTEYLK